MFLGMFAEISAAFSWIKAHIMTIQDDTTKAAADFQAYVANVDAFIAAANKGLADNATATAAAVAQAKADAAAGDVAADTIVTNLDTAIQQANTDAQTALGALTPPAAPAAPAPPPAPSTGALTVSLTPAFPGTPNVGDAYTGQLSADGGDAPYTWSVTSGQIPHGLTLDAVKGVLAGTFAEAQDAAFTVTATDSTTPTGATGSIAFTGTVNAPGA